MTRELVHFISGDYYQPGSLAERQLRTNATAYFLEAIARHHPQVLHNLKESVLPAFRAAVNGLRGVECPDPTRQAPIDDLQATWPDVRVDKRVEHLTELIREHPCVVALGCLNVALRTWAERHHLTLPRLLETGLATVAAWHREKWRCRELLWNHWQAQQPEPLELHCAPFSAPGWSPDGEPKEHARRRLLAAVEIYLDQVERQVRQDGWRPSPTRSEIESHVQWLAQYQIDGTSINQIAGVEDQRKTIAAGIENAGELIAGDDWRWWKRQPAKGGRPKKSR